MNIGGGRNVKVSKRLVVSLVLGLVLVTAAGCGNGNDNPPSPADSGMGTMDHSNMDMGENSTNK